MKAEEASTSPFASVGIVQAVLLPAIVALVWWKIRSPLGLFIVVAACFTVYAHRSVLQLAWTIPASRAVFVAATAISTTLSTAVLLRSGTGRSPADIWDYLLVVWVFVLPVLAFIIRKTVRGEA
jgi:hypothetical protein